MGTSLVIQWLRLHTDNAESTGWIPGEGTKILHAFWHSQKFFYKPIDEELLKNLLRQLRLNAWDKCSGLVHWEDPEGWGGEGGGRGDQDGGTHVNPWLIHVNVWQKPLQYCKVVSLQLIKINKKKRKRQVRWSGIPISFKIFHSLL